MSKHFEALQTNAKNKNWYKPKRVTLESPVFTDYDVEVKVECCGVCGSDVHGAKKSWGITPDELVVGHEIVGTVVSIGSKVTKVKLGQRVGIGAQQFACLECKRCKNGNEQYCKKQRWTYGFPYPDGKFTSGGYANLVRAHEHFVFDIPKGLDSELIAPFLCGGITVFSPLIRNGCGPGKKVGISGIGGIGHMGILLAKALGAEVYAISRSHSKEKDALELGADHYISTNDEDWWKSIEEELDLIVNCGSSLSGINIDEFLKTLVVHGKFVSISAPPIEEVFEVSPFSILGNGAFISASAIGSRAEIIQMLKLVDEKKLKPWIETVPISEKGVAEVLKRANDGDVKYRFTLVDYDKYFS